MLLHSRSLRFLNFFHLLIKRIAFCYIDYTVSYIYNLFIFLVLPFFHLSIQSFSSAPHSLFFLISILLHMIVKHFSR